MRDCRKFLTLAVLVCASAARAGAADFTVQPTFDDETDAVPGDGICASVNGTCTLRAAVQEANALPGPDRILVPSDFYFLRLGGAHENLAATGDLDLTDDVTIVGEDSRFTTIRVIDDRVFQVWPGVTVEISGLTIELGEVIGESGGGIDNLRGIVTLRDVDVRANTAEVSGGGINNVGRMTLINVTVTENVTFGSGGGIASSGLLTVFGSTISSNAAQGGGGGLAAGAPSVVAVTGSTISGNFAASFSGGGIENEASVPGLEARMSLRNVTVSGNTARQNGGGVMNEWGEVMMIGGTVTGNSALLGGGVATREDQGSTTGTFVLANTIVAANPRGSDCGFGFMRSLGHNLDSDGSCPFREPGDLSNRNPLLGPLGFERGNSLPPPTHALHPFSPAIDRGAPTFCSAKDERAKPRFVDGNGDGLARCDIGAVEYQWKEPDSCDLNLDGLYMTDD
ncbi:MAG TPA: choice-of-anchor Q domain-containing protein, partial [Vicinamibacterales bacterium]